MKKIGLVLSLLLVAILTQSCISFIQKLWPPGRNVITFDSSTVIVKRSGFRAVLMLYTAADFKAILEESPPGPFDEDDEHKRRLAVSKQINELAGVTTEQEERWRKKVTVVMIVAVVDTAGRTPFRLTNHDECGIRRGKQEIKSLTLHRPLTARPGTIAHTYIVLPVTELRPDDVIYIRFRERE